MIIICILMMMGLFVTLNEAQTCPNSRECKCQGSGSNVILYCARENLLSVPAFSPTPLTFSEVTLAGNSISSLTANAFKTSAGVGLQTRILDLSGNRITNIDNNAFSGIGDRLEILKLDVSGMTQFPTTAISQLPNLKQLFVKGFNMVQLPTNALLSLTKLEVLSLDTCGLNTLNIGDFTSQVNVLKEVYLAGNKFTTVPKQGLNSLQQMTKLDMTKNIIATIESNSFSGMNRLETLLIVSNGVTTIQNDAFNGVQDTLKYLSLKSNSEIIQEDLTPLTILSNLEELDLSFNKISEIPRQFFIQMSKLKVLAANNNQLSRLESLSFQGLENSLTELNLRMNLISSITNSFSALRNLKSLDLSDQDLSSTYNQYTFSGLESTLESLTLSTTMFSNLHWSAISNLRGLKTLKLDVNKVNTLPNDVFSNLNSLQTLHLKHNGISELRQQSFKGLQFSLEKIYLDSNSISTINKCVFHNFQKLSLIEVDFNPLNCDCQLVWLHEFVHDHNMQDATYWTCVSPAQHKDKEFIQIPVSELTCATEPPIQQCEDYTLTTTLSTLTNEITPPGGSPYPMVINITEVTDTSMRVAWLVETSTSNIGWAVTCSDINTGVTMFEETFAVTVRQCVIEGLAENTEYSICVQTITTTPSSQAQTCTSESTMPKGMGILSKQDRLQIILGCILGIVLLFIVSGILICVYIKWRNKNSTPSFKPEDGLSNDGSYVPAVTDNSKRFSKPKSTSLCNLNSVPGSDPQLDGFSIDERNKILDLLSNRGVSTISMLSAISNRYSQEPNGSMGVPSGHYNPRQGYINPNFVSMSEFSRQNSGPYNEIQDTYDEIPADQVGQENGAYSMPTDEAVFTPAVPPGRTNSSGTKLDRKASDV